MERVEYTTDGNTIGISIKYPDGIRRKWSEDFVDIECDECESTHISSDKSGDVLTLTCHSCENFWQGYVNKVLTWYDTEEALVRLLNIQFSENEG